MNSGAEIAPVTWLPIQKFVERVKRYTPPRTSARASGIPRGAAALRLPTTEDIVPFAGGLNALETFVVFVSKCSGGGQSGLLSQYTALGIGGHLKYCVLLCG